MPDFRPAVFRPLPKGSDKNRLDLCASRIEESFYESFNWDLMILHEPQRAQFEILYLGNIYDITGYRLRHYNTVYFLM